LASGDTSPIVISASTSLESRAIVLVETLYFSARTFEVSIKLPFWQFDLLCEEEGEVGEKQGDSSSAF
jgi:hypothetical protein